MLTKFGQLCIHLPLNYIVATIFFCIITIKNCDLHTMNHILSVPMSYTQHTYLCTNMKIVGNHNPSGETKRQSASNQSSIRLMHFYVVGVDLVIIYL